MKATIHWVSANHGIAAEVRLYDRLFKVEDPGSAEKAGTPFGELLNENSLQVLKGCLVEPELQNPAPESHFQFERLGYFTPDSKECRQGTLVFNRTVTLRDQWTKEKGKR